MLTAPLVPSAAVARPSRSRAGVWRAAVLAVLGWIGAILIAGFAGLVALALAAAAVVKLVIDAGFA